MLEQRRGMRLIEGGVYRMGSDAFYPEESPRRRVSVDAFRIDEEPVTNDRFAAFVEATSHVTLAEVAPDPDDYPGMDPGLAQAGSLVFHQTPAPVPLDDPSSWWAFVPGADWRHPTGPGSDLDGLGTHPVVHVAYKDAAAYASWADKTLPSEAQWEFAARGGLQDAEYAWGDELAPSGKVLANYWQGLFPFANQKEGGAFRTTPVGSYPTNGYGLHDMIGNVWEWTRDWYADGAVLAPKRPCCVVANPRGGTRHGSIGGKEQVRIARRVLKGGSHLCATNYCQRYRPAARHAQMVDSATGHIGFRCVASA